MIKVIKRLVAYLVFSIFLIKGVLLFAEETEGASSGATSYSSAMTDHDLTAGLIGRIVTYLALLGAIGFVIVYFFKQGKFIRGMRNSGRGNQLKVCETRVLGNKQFLVVVEYGKQRVLLGVGPGMINKLCFLDVPDKSSRIEKDKTKDPRDEDVADINLGV